MRIEDNPQGLKVSLSARDTWDWATRPGKVWPCSFLSDRRVFAEFGCMGDLVDLSIDGGKGDQDCPSDELNAIMDDLVWNRE